MKIAKIVFFGVVLDFSKTFAKGLYIRTPDLRQPRAAPDSDLSPPDLQASAKQQRTALSPLHKRGPSPFPDLHQLRPPRRKTCLPSPRFALLTPPNGVHRFDS